MTAIQLRDETTETAPAPVANIKRRSRWGWWVALAVVAVAVAAFVLRPGAGSDEVTYVTETATVGSLDAVVEATGVVGFPDDTVVGLSPRVGGTVTDVHIGSDDPIDPMSAILDVDGGTLWAVTGGAPLYRDLRVGTEGPDVETLEESLTAAGYDPGEVDEEFDRDTEAALEAWQEDNDLEASGRLIVASFLWAPSDSVALDVDAAPGDFVAAGEPLVTAGPTEGQVVRVNVDQADISDVAVGDDVLVDIDGLDDSLTGTVTSVSTLPVNGTDFEVVVSVDMVEGLRTGMEGTVTIVTDTLADVVLVPTGALGGSSTAPSIDVVVDGVAETRSVTTGLITPTQVEIVSGVSAGEQVVIGEVAS
jgi:multidrug efflux pump subunit AcrA (membrane-fusion protein)